MAYTPATPVTQQALAKLEKAFFDAARKQLRFLDKTKVKLVEIPERTAMTMISYDSGLRRNVVLLQEYSDYYELQHGDNFEAVAEKLGFAAGSLFNGLATHAMRKYGWGVSIVDPLTNNMKFTCVSNAGPSVADPMGDLMGWMSFRLQFGAGA